MPNTNLNPQDITLYKGATLGYFTPVQELFTIDIDSYPPPKDTKQLKQFLNLSNYYRKFIKNYASIAEPLHKVLWKTFGGYCWNAQCEQSFNQKLTNPPILSYPNFKVPFMVSTDTSFTATGGILSQMSNGTERVIA